MPGRVDCYYDDTLPVACTTTMSFIAIAAAPAAAVVVIVRPRNKEYKDL